MEKPASPLYNPSMYQGVLLHSCELVFDDVDLHIPGRGFDFVFQRTYRSKTLYSGVLGWNWDHNYNKRLLMWPNGDVIYYDGTGRRERYQKSTSIEQYTAPAGRFTQLRRLEDGSFRLTFAQGVVEFFDLYGRLVKIQDRNKNKMEFYYDFSGQLSTVVDTMGRLIHFEYNYYEFDTNGNVKPGSLRLSKIRDFDGRTVEFTYDVNTGDLIEVNVGKGETNRRFKKYGYSQNGDIKLAHNLENYIDPRGYVGEGAGYPQNTPILTVQYDTNDKVVSQTWDDAVTSFAMDGSAATVTDARDNEKTIAYNTKGQVQSVSEGAHTTFFGYDTNTGLPDTVTYPRGNAVRYDYAAGSNLVTSVTELPGGLPVDDSAENQRVTSFDYEYFTNNLKSVTYPNGLKQNYNYNEYGQLVSQYRSFDGTTLGMTTTYEYYPETAPGGDGTSNNNSPRELDNETGGYLKKAARSLNVISDWNGQLYNEFTYDKRGNVNKVDSSSGITSTYQVNEFNNVEYEATVSTTSLSPLTYNASFDYDGNGNVKNRITNFGLPGQSISNTYEYTYTKRNMLHDQKETAKGLTTTYDYDKNDNIRQISSTNVGANTLDSMSFTYNTRDLVETVQMGSNAGSSAFSYDGNGNIQAYTNRFGHAYTYEYDGYDRMRAVTDPLNQRTEILRFDMGDRVEVKEYDSASNLLRETVTVHDPLGRMKDYTVKVPNSTDEQYVYQYQQDGEYMTTITTDSLGRTWTVIKNDKGQVVEESGPGGSTQYGYIYTGRRLTKVIKTDTEKKPDNTDETYVTEYYYNDFNKVEKIVENPNAPEEFIFITELFYDKKGNLKESKDAEGNVISHEYDDFGRKTRTKKRFKDAAKHPITTEFTYYENDLLKTVKDDKGNVTTYEYDDQKRLKKVTYPDNSFIGYAYTEKAVGSKKYRVVTETQRNNTVVTNDYDELNRLKTRTIARAAGVGGTTAETYEYDGLSRLWKAINDDFTVEREYDTLNRLMKEKQMGKWIDYTYGIEDSRRKMTTAYPNGRIIERKFDVLDRVSKVREGANDLAGYEYIGRGYRYLKKELNNGDVTNYLYDQGRRLASMEAKNINLDLINKYVYGYNKVHMRMYEERGHDSNKGDVYDYDEFQRLTHVKFNSPEPQVHETTQFDKSWSAQYDKVDNILSIVETENQTTNEIIPTMDEDNVKLNQYTTFDQWGLSYDQNGNTTQKGTQSFTYDYRSQLVSTSDGSTSADYKYDALGRRVQKIVTTGAQTDTTNYYYSGNQVIEERDGSDAVLKQYVYGNGIDELLIIVNFDGATQSDYYVHTNSIGSVTAITDQDGNLVERVSYDTFGMPTFTDCQTDPQNPTVVSDSLIGNDILFQGRRYDEETNLYYYRARYYDPIMGRFLQTDPVGYNDSMNLYQAFNMNGVNYLDPFGKLIRLTGSDREGDFDLIKKIFRTLGISNIDEYIEMDDEGFIMLKKKFGALRKAGMKYHIVDTRKKTYKAYLKLIEKYSIELKNWERVYTKTLIELFEWMIHTRKGTIEFRTGDEFYKSGKIYPVSSKGGGVCLEPDETKNGNIEIVVDPNISTVELPIWRLIKTSSGSVANKKKLKLGIMKDTVIVHEFGHAIASLWGFKSESDGRTENMFTDMAVMFENLFRIRKGQKRLRPRHNPTLFFPSISTYEEHVYKLEGHKWVSQR